MSELLTKSEAGGTCIPCAKCGKPATQASSRSATHYSATGWTTWSGSPSFTWLCLSCAADLNHTPPQESKQSVLPALWHWKAAQVVLERHEVVVRARDVAGAGD